MTGCFRRFSVLLEPPPAALQCILQVCAKPLCWCPHVADSHPSHLLGQAYSQATSRVQSAHWHANSSRVRRHDSINLTTRTSHLTPHTSHLTPHTSHLTPHISLFKLQIRASSGDHLRKRGSRAFRPALDACQCARVVRLDNFTHAQDVRCAFR